MPESSEEDAQQKLKAALWFAVGKMVDEQCLYKNQNATPQFIGALTELVWHQIQTIALDLETFSQHAGRSTITTQDILLLARRNDDLHHLLKDFIDESKDEEDGAEGKKTKKAGAR